MAAACPIAVGAAKAVLVNASSRFPFVIRAGDDRGLQAPFVRTRLPMPFHDLLFGAAEVV
jgi:hypothetical protein